jgi:signal transduction histidine kinase
MVLITNALEATPPGGRVSIKTKAYAGINGSPASVGVIIEDTGEGIAPDIRDRVFEPFFTTKAYGTGIGLPLAKKFVERNGGKISVSDGSRGGARFDITFQTNAGMASATASPQGAIFQPQTYGLDAQSPDRPA